MKIGIVTLPLHTNYGGILQAYALKTVLEGMGHEAELLDRKKKVWSPHPLKVPFIYAKRMLQKAVRGKNGPEVCREFRLRREYLVITADLQPFVDSRINPRMIDTYKEIAEGEYDAFVVGSDQVWRPIYQESIYDAYLQFAEKWDVKRVAYAASFGTDELEYEYVQLERCAELLGKFDGVSVREENGVRLCDEWLDCDRAVHVLDPVMLLEPEHYRELARSAAGHPSSGKVVTYILDSSPLKNSVAGFVSRVMQKSLHDISTPSKERSIPLEERIIPAIEQWITGFADADFVVTDSFHGCVLSILFHKPFLVIGNRLRGISRIESLLKIFSLESRLVEGIDPDDDGEGWLTQIDWQHVGSVLEIQRQKSMQFLFRHFK